MPLPIVIECVVRNQCIPTWAIFEAHKCFTFRVFNVVSLSLPHVARHSPLTLYDDIDNFNECKYKTCVSYSCADFGRCTDFITACLTLCHSGTTYIVY